ncbi:hypothetical protein [Hugenholtzia roseola]|uniref:hypothetical protein n=1 Tax=Hugenholtzia roseola TaxID=1002 RepID=UPI0003F92E9D|nr:hypothetical protein [Hugenholtzia roseola]
MKTLFFKYKWATLGILLGGIAGFFYWKEVGCLNGQCLIQSVWYNSTGYGMLLGGLLASMIADAVGAIKKTD